MKRKNATTVTRNGSSKRFKYLPHLNGSLTRILDQVKCLPNRIIDKIYAPPSHLLSNEDPVLTVVLKCSVSNRDLIISWKYLQNKMVDEYFRRYSADKINFQKYLISTGICELSELPNTDTIGIIFLGEFLKWIEYSKTTFPIDDRKNRMKEGFEWAVQEVLNEGTEPLLNDPKGKYVELATLWGSCITWNECLEPNGYYLDCFLVSKRHLEKHYKKNKLKVVSSEHEVSDGLVEIWSLDSQDASTNVGHILNRNGCTFNDSEAIQKGSLQIKTDLSMEYIGFLKEICHLIQRSELTFENPENPLSSVLYQLSFQHISPKLCNETIRKHLVGAITPGCFNYRTKYTNIIPEPGMQECKSKYVYTHLSINELNLIYKNTIAELNCLMGLTVLHMMSLMDTIGYRDYRRLRGIDTSFGLLMVRKELNIYPMFNKVKDISDGECIHLCKAKDSVYVDFGFTTPELRYNLHLCTLALLGRRAVYTSFSSKKTMCRYMDGLGYPDCELSIKFIKEPMNYLKELRWFRRKTFILARKHLKEDSQELRFLNRLSSDVFTYIMKFL